MIREPTEGEVKVTAALMQAQAAQAAAAQARLLAPSSVVAANGMRPDDTVVDNIDGPITENILYRDLRNMDAAGRVSYAAANNLQRLPSDGELNVADAIRSLDRGNALNMKTPPLKVDLGFLNDPSFRHPKL